MLKSIRITLMIVLVVLGATACGGGGGGSGSSTPAGTAKKGLIIDTGSTERPYIYISPEGNSYTYAADPATGKPSGLTVSTLKGEDIVISLNTATGMVDHWVYNDHVVYFTNYRATSGLVDVAVIYPDGATQYFLDIAYKPPASTASNLLLPDSSNTSLLPGKNASVMLAKAGNWPAFFNALGVTIGAAICASDAIIALGVSTPLAAEAATIFPITMPVALGTASVAVLCAGKTGLAITAMAPDTKVVSGSDVNRDVVLSHTDIDLINETVGYSFSDLFANSASCIKKILAKDISGLKDCVFAGTDAVSVLGSSTLQRVSGSFQAASSLLKDKKAKGIFCCNGPDQLKPGQTGTWQAIVLGGPDTVDQAFDFGDPPGITLADFTISANNPLSSDHTYTSIGQYMINVSAMLQGTTITRSKNFPVRVYDSLNVNCCTASGTLLSDGSSFRTGTEIRLRLEVTGGKQPYLYEFDLDAGKKASIHGNSILSVDVIYDKPGTYSTFVKVTDDDGMIAMSNVKLLTVKDTSTTADTYKDFTASMCPNTFHNGSLSSPELLTNNGYSLQDNEFSRTALCSYTSLDGQQTPVLEINWRTVSAGTSSTDTCSGKADDPYWFEAWRQASSQSRWVSVRWTGFFTNKTAIENAVKQVLADAVANGVGVTCQ